MPWPKTLGAVRRNRPLTVLDDGRNSPRALSSASVIVLAYGSSASPSAVRDTARVVRWKRRAPSSSSSAASLRETCMGETSSWRPAADRVPAATTARNTRRSATSITLSFMVKPASLRPRLVRRIPTSSLGTSAQTVCYFWPERKSYDTFHSTNLNANRYCRARTVQSPGGGPHDPRQRYRIGRCHSGNGPLLRTVRQGWFRPGDHRRSVYRPGVLTGLSEPARHGK
ncbi:hypothetical protein D3C79_736580 [compost metagenome]